LAAKGREAMPTAPATAAIGYHHQHSLKSAAHCAGRGLHSGAEVTLALRPAAPDRGIRFRRVDLVPAVEVVADWRHVVDGQRATTLGDGGPVRIGTVEHLMAALAACGVDNAVIEIDGPELPAMDGSAAPFVAAIQAAGLAEQTASRRAIEVLKPVAIDDGDRHVALTPASNLQIAFTIDYPDTAIGRQSLDADAAAIDIRTAICPARTFCLEAEVEALRAGGLGLGGSLANTLVVGPQGLLNEDGLHFADEFVRHKVLDCMGDLYLLGRPLVGRFEGVRSGHAMTHALVAALVADREAWREIEVGSAGE
jgi:UDP-3-O-[3-hydroxymyristoyl] N-acetylglucosamine deacetylase